MQGMPSALHAWLRSGRRSKRSWHYRDELGQGLVEYGMILALIAMVCAGAVRLFGENLAAWSAWNVLAGL